MPWMNPMVVKAWDKLAPYVRSDIFCVHTVRDKALTRSIKNGMIGAQGGGADDHLPDYA